MENKKETEIKRIFMISDLHFGVRSNSLEWLKIQTEYFYNYFIPLVKQHRREGDACFILGDIFDSRQSINILVMNSCIQVFQELAKLFGEDGVYVMAGNHDCWTKDSAEVHSLVCLSGIPNVHVYNTAGSLKSPNSNIILLPWGLQADEEKEFLESTSSDILFVHTDIKGARFNSKVRVEHGNGTDSYRRHKKVYGGHIHYRQSVSDFITLIGSPYQMTRTDIGNRKGVYLLDLETKEEIFIENYYSPEFISANFDSIIDMNREELDLVFLNKFVDLKVGKRWFEEVDIPSFALSFKTQRSIELQEVDDSESLELDESLDIDFFDEATPNFDILTLTKELVSALEFDEETKNKIENKITLLYERISEE